MKHLIVDILDEPIIKSWEVFKKQQVKMNVINYNERSPYAMDKDKIKINYSK